MNRSLREVAKYSKERVLLEDLDLSTYVTTDNLLQNKEGKVEATNLPPNGKTVTKFSKNDILIANIRPYLKKIWLATHDGGNSSDVLTLKVNDKYNPSFIYYALFRDIFFEHMMNGSKGTKMPRGDKNQVLDFPIPNFEKPKQDRIAKVLSDLDKKIELNKKINKELESMAKLIYDYWFVQFDFPDENGKPYKSSGGKMEFIEELNREIPDGWSYEKVGDILGSRNWGKKLKSSKYLEKGTIPIVDQSSDFICGFTNDEDLTIKVEKVPLIVFGDHTRNLKLINFDFARGADGTQVLLSDHENVPQHYFYHALSKIDLSNYGYARHYKFLKEKLIVIPDRKIVDKFESVVKAKYDLIKKNIEENRALVELRDWLLPMLMNGQVTVKEAEKELSIAAEPETEYKTSNKPTNVDYYRRTVLAAEIVWQLHQQPTLGHVKLQKVIYLAKQTSNMMLPTNFLKQAAGPYDPKMARSIDKQLKKNKWFEFQKDEYLKYKPLEKAGEHRADFDKYFHEEKENIQFLMNTFKKAKTAQVEIVATLYACWKELIEKGKTATDDLLIEQFYNWSEEKSKFKQERLFKAINWMKDKGVYPVS